MEDLERLESQRDALRDAIAQGDIDRAEGRESRRPWIENRSALVGLLAGVLNSIEELHGRNR